MWPHWACVAAEQWPKEKLKKPATAATLAQGDVEVVQAVARRWAVLSTGRVFARRNEDEHPDWRHYRTASGRQGKSPSIAKTVTAALVSLEFRVESLELWGVESGECGVGSCFLIVICTNVLSSLRQVGPSTGSGTLYGVRLLALAAEWSPQAFLGG